TAILKYSAPYMAGVPLVPFSPERSVFEARALTHIPWQTFQYTSVLEKYAAGACQGVDLPKLYSHDPRNHILVIEDCTPERRKHESSRGHSTNMIRQLLNDVAESEKKHATVSSIGGMLGAFLAQLQSWGCQSQSHQTAVELFGKNDSAREMIIQETFADFFTNLKQTGYQISSAQRAKLEPRLYELERLVRDSRESVCIGDFWEVAISRSGNVLLSLDSNNDPERMSIIDWEFVTMAPTFVDVGNFIRELFLNNYFESSNPCYVTVLESFMKAYLGFGIQLSVKDALGFGSARAIWSLSIRVHSPKSKASKVSAVPCVEQLLKFIIDPGDEHLDKGKEDLIENLARLMRERIDQINGEEVLQ
ncbi:hypothetical protein K505DRAFT_243165, partial [Melanomma pulvis-pyrius CBS 109.77]